MTKVESKKQKTLKIKGTKSGKKLKDKKFSLKINSKSKSITKAKNVEETDKNAQKNTTPKQTTQEKMRNFILNSANTQTNDDKAKGTKLLRKDKKKGFNKMDKLKNKFRESFTMPKDKQPIKTQTLRERMLVKLKAARFRYLNEQIYSANSEEAMKLFQEDSDAFKAYHEGYRQQVSQWPVNPIDEIIKKVKKMPKEYVIADLGCGEAKLSKSVKQTVHSFDLVAVDASVTACDMSKVPLDNDSVDVVVFCLSLMGTNLRDYFMEANRLLKTGGILKIAEVESRFDKISEFIEGVEHFGFKNTWKDQSHNLFYFIDFKKERNVRNKQKMPTISLHPCLYKKR